jgi:hypothetical protein
MLSLITYVREAPGTANHVSSNFGQAPLRSGPGAHPADRVQTVDRTSQRSLATIGAVHKIPRRGTCQHRCANQHRSRLLTPPHSRHSTAPRLRSRWHRSGAFFSLLLIASRGGPRCTFGESQRRLLSRAAHSSRSLRLPQPPPVVWSPIMQKDRPDTPGKEMLMLTVNYPPGAAESMHRREHLHLSHVVSNGPAARGRRAPRPSRRTSFWRHGEAHAGSQAYSGICSGLSSRPRSRSRLIRL